MRHVTMAGVVAAALGAAASATAQTTGADIQAWPSVAATASIGPRLEIRADGLLQITDDLTRVGRELLRVVAMVDVNGRVALGGGYTWTRVAGGAGSRRVEHRAVQQLDVRLPIAIGAAVVSSRTRLEERRQEGAAAVAIRLRELVRVDVPLARRGARAVVWSEYFHAFNRTEWSGRAGPALVLTFVGVHVPLTGRAAIEPGYLNQTNIVAGRNQARHVVAAFFAVRLSQSGPPRTATTRN